MLLSLHLPRLITVSDGCNILVKVMTMFAGLQNINGHRNL